MLASRILEKENIYMSNNFNNTQLIYIDSDNIYFEFEVPKHTNEIPELYFSVNKNKETKTMIINEIIGIFNKVIFRKPYEIIYDSF